MKYTQTSLVHLCILLLFAACRKEQQSPLIIDTPAQAIKYDSNIKAKDFSLKKIKNTITYPPSLSPTPIEEFYELTYNNRGDIERLTVTTKYDGSIREAYYLAHYKGARMNSISGNSTSGSWPLFSGIKYKGNHIVETLFHSGFRDPEKKTFEYNDKGRLLTGLNGMQFTYNERGLLVKITYPNDYFNAFYTYESTSNPLYIEYIYLFLTYGNLNELCYSQWNIATKRQGEQIITHQNSYDERGRLKTKTYSEGIASYKVEFSYY